MAGEAGTVKTALPYKINMTLSKKKGACCKPSLKQQAIPIIFIILFKIVFC